MKTRKERGIPLTISEREMVVEMNPSVKLVAEFMQRNLQADELQSVAEALALIAPAIWGRYKGKKIHPMSLSEPPIRPFPK